MEEETIPPMLERMLSKTYQPGVIGLDFGCTNEHRFVPERIWNPDFDIKKGEPKYSEIDAICNAARGKQRRQDMGQRHYDMQFIDPYTTRVCGMPMELVGKALEMFFSYAHEFPTSAIKDVIAVLEDNDYMKVRRCISCDHYKMDGCYLKGYRQSKKQNDFCSLHSSLVREDNGSHV